MTGTFAEFFAGIGLVRLALEQLEWHCVFANDIDPKKTEIYRQNFPANELWEGDIFDLTLADIPARADLWTASFPCIDLSLAGNRRGLNGTHSRAYWGFIELLKAARGQNTQPALLLVENVVGFASSAGGVDLAEALTALSHLGYRYDILVLDAKHFTPQSRPRLFIVAEHQSSTADRLHPSDALRFERPFQPRVVTRFVGQHPELNWAHLDLPPLPELGPSLGSVIEQLPPNHAAWWPQSGADKLIAAMSPLNRQRLDKMLASEFTEYGTVYRRVRNGQTMAELRWDGLAGCLRTPRGGSSKQFLLETREGQVRVRSLTVRECAALQGVPEIFRFNVPDNQAWYGLGDAVCVPAVKWLATSLLNSQQGASDPQSTLELITAKSG